MKKDNHKKSINHIRRIIGQLKALEETIDSDSSCIQISTEMFSILQSMKGLSERMFINAIQNGVFDKSIDDKEKKKLKKLIKLIS